MEKQKKYFVLGRRPFAEEAVAAVAAEKTEKATTTTSQHKRKIRTSAGDDDDDCFLDLDWDETVKSLQVNPLESSAIRHLLK